MGWVGDSQCTGPPSQIMHAIRRDVVKSMDIWKFGEELGEIGEVRVTLLIDQSDMLKRAVNRSHLLFIPLYGKGCYN